MARTASATDIFSYTGETEPLPHGGDLAAARRLFPGAPEPFIDLSTGINPVPYTLPEFSADSFTRLPDQTAADALLAAAARAYGVSSADHVAAAPGTQILLPLVAGLVPPGKAAIIAPTYPEFARAAALAGHAVSEIHDLAAAADFRLVFVANPNNPDGRLFSRDDLLALATSMGMRGGLLVVDEAFMDVGPGDASLAPDVDHGGIVVLRSFGKFFGLAGLRLGFALAAPDIAAQLRAILGPWAVSGPALATGTRALTDIAWMEQTKKQLAQASRRLDNLLIGARLDIAGGTTLFRLARTPDANGLFLALGRAGILTRAFAEQPYWLRFGLPPDERAWLRLQQAMAAFQSGGQPAAG